MLEAQQIGVAVLRVAGVKWALRTPETGYEFCFGAASRTSGHRDSSSPSRWADSSQHLPFAGPGLCARGAAVNGTDKFRPSQSLTF